MAPRITVASLGALPAASAAAQRYRIGLLVDNQNTEPLFIGEIRFTIFVEDRELVTLMCSPWQLRPLVMGFLYLEGLIETVDDVQRTTRWLAETQYQISHVIPSLLE